MRQDVNPSIWESAHSVLLMYGVRGQTLAVVTGCRSTFLLSGEVEVGPLGQAKSIAE